MGPPLREARLLLRLGKLPFALRKTTAVIPFTVLVYGVNDRTVLDGVETPRALLVLKIVDKPHTGSPRWSPTKQSILASLPDFFMRIALLIMLTLCLALLLFCLHGMCLL